MSVKVRRTRVPRASIAVTIMQDLDLITLCQSAAGREAVALFFMLIAEAKAQRNGGRFAAKDEVIAALVHWPVRDFRRAVKALASIDRPWIVRDGGALVIRSFQAWNGDYDGWGGARHGAGRPPSCNQDQIQEAIKMNIQDESRECASVSLTESIPPPPRTSYAVSGDVPDSPPDGGGGGGSAAPEPQGAPPPAPPAGQAGPLARIGTQPSAADPARRSAVMRALDAVTIADPGIRLELADSPCCTASLVRKVQRDNPTAGPGALVRCLRVAIRAAESAAQARADREAKARADAAAESQRDAAMREQHRRSADEMAAVRARLAVMPGVELASLVDAVIAERPELEHLRKFDPRSSPFWLSVLAGRLDRYHAEAQRSQREAVMA